MTDDGGHVTPEQTIARRTPCLLAVETLHPRYRRLAGAWSLVLTVNTGYE